MKLPTWSVYKYLELEERERIHLDWCRQFHKDPNSEDHVNEFFDLIDAVPEVDPNAPAARTRPTGPTILPSGKTKGRPRKTPT